MTTLPETVKEAIAKQDFFPVATAAADGTPNVIYIKYLKVIDDETVLLADNYFHKTRENIANNPKVAFVVLDSEKGSYQVKGSAKRLTEGPLFEDMRKWVAKELPREAAVEMKVEKVYNGANQL